MCEKEAGGCVSDHGGNNVVYVAGEEEDAGDDLPQLFFSFF